MEKAENPSKSRQKNAKNMLKRFVILVLSALITSLSFAQIEQIDSRAEMLKQLQEAQNPEIVLNNTPYPFFSYEYYKDVAPFNLLNHQLYCANERRSERYATGPAVIVLTLSKDNIVSIEKLKNGTYYDVVEILSTMEQKINLATTLKSTKTFIGDTVHYRMQDDKLREYKFSKKDVETLLNSLSLQDNSKNVIYVLQDNSGKKYFLWHYRHTNAAISNKFMYFVYGDYAKLQDFVSVNTFNHIKSTYEGKEIVSEPYYDNPLLSDKEDCVYTTKKVIVLDGQIGLKLKHNKDGEEKNIYVNNEYIRHLEYHIDLEYKKDSLLVLSGYALRTDADSLLAKREQEKQQAEREKLAKDEKRKQELIKKYRQKYAEDIMNGKATVGMNKEMCKAAIGTPDNITTSTNSNGNIEVWEYSRYHRYYPSLYPIIIVTFTNGKVTMVNEYDNYIY